MKAILEFNLPEEKEDHRLALQAQDMHRILVEFYQESLRKRTRYKEYKNKAVAKEVEAITSEFILLMNEFDIQF